MWVKRNVHSTIKKKGTITFVHSEVAQGTRASLKL